MTALHFAASAGADDVCRLLMYWGADAEAADDDGRVPLDLLPRWSTCTAAERDRWRALLRPSGRVETNPIIVETADEIGRSD